MTDQTDSPSDSPPASPSAGKAWKELGWAIGTLAVCGIVGERLIATIPLVNELPDGTTAIEYVVNAGISRFGVPVVALLFLAAAATVLGHNGGNGRPNFDFAAKLFSLGAAMFSLMIVWVGFSFSGEVAT